MRICMVSWHGCIRVFKEAKALVDQGHEVELLTQSLPFGYNIFNAVHVWHDEEQFRRSVAALKPDIFHVHNEPDWIVHATKDANPNIPVIYDIHDLESLRWQNEPDEDERKAWEAASGIVHVSETCRQFAEKQHGKKRNILLFPYVNGMFYSQAQDVSWSTLCYEGGLSADPLVIERPGDEREHVNMRNYIPAVQAFIEQGFSVYLFAAGEKLFENATYENLGAFIAKGLVYTSMLAGLRACGFGLVGSVMSSPLMEASMANKVFEYISQGVVPVCLNSSTAADFVEQYGIGIRLKGLENLKIQLEEGPAKRKALLHIRDEFKMENHIGRLVRLYEEVLNAC